MTILYGQPDDPEEFRRYYYDTHIPIARQMKGLSGWNLSWIDNDPAAPSDYLLIARLCAESADAMDAVLSSPEGQTANADLHNFATGTVEFLSGAEEEVALA